jgi:hypothetical protein
MRQKRDRGAFRRPQSTTTQVAAEKLNIDRTHLRAKSKEQSRHIFIRARNTHS